MMGRFILGVIIGILIVFAGVYFYFTTGMAPAAATAQPMPFETYFAKKALHMRMVHEAPKTAALKATPDNLLAGAHIYKQDCSFCHSLPNEKTSEEGRGMFPQAPQLFTKADMVTDDPVGNTYWKIKNGIRLTGMPSFENTLTEQQLWQVTLLLKNADKLPPNVSAALAPAPTPATPAPVAEATKPASPNHR